MTNDSSMTITRTDPAQEIDSSIMRGDPMPVAEDGSAPPVSDAPGPAMVQKIGNTIYEVSFYFSTTSKETMSDKIRRLILRDLEAS